MRPRPVYPGVTQMVTRRTSQQQFWLEPTPFVRLVFSFCLAWASWKYGVQVHATVVMSNHWHAIVTDVRGQLPRFMHWVDVHMAKILNLRYGRRQNLFDNRQHQPQVLPRAEDVRRAIVYLLLNPVRAGLVAHSREWKGLITRTSELAGGSSRKLRRPAFFRRRGPVGPFVRLVHHLPPACAGMDPKIFREQVAQAVADGEEAIAAERAAAGKGFLGMPKVLALGPSARPPSQDAPGIRPQVLCRDKTLRDRWLARLRDFRERYAEARSAWRRGARDATFPAGTWQMRREHTVACDPLAPLCPPPP